MIQQVIAIATKDLRLLVRDRGALFFTVFFPVVIAILFGMVFGKMSTPNPFEVVVVVEEPGPLANSFATALRGDSALVVESAPNRESAIDAVRKKRVAAAIIFPVGFDARAETIFSGGSMPIDCVGDPSRAAEIGLLQGKLMEIGFRQLMLVVSDRDRLMRPMGEMRNQIEGNRQMSDSERTAVLKILAGVQELSGAKKGEEQGSNAIGGATAAFEFRPVSIRAEMMTSGEIEPPSSYAVTFPQGVVWGLAGCVMAFVTTFVGERAQGTMTRLRAAPISMQIILVGKALGCVVSSLVMQALLLTLAWSVFGVRPLDPWTLLLAMSIVSIVFTALAMMIAALFESSGAAEGAGRALVIVLAIVGGGSIPLVFMPPLLRTISVASPFRWAISAIEGPLWRGGSIAEQFAAMGSIAIVGVVCASIAIVAVAVRRRGS